MDALGRALIADVRHRVGHGYPAQIRASLEALDEAELWQRPHDSSNSVGNLVLHLCGSTRHFLGRGVGGSDFERDRPAEFAEKGPIAKAELLKRLEETVAESEGVLDALDPARLLETSDRAGKPQTLAELLLRVSHHWAVHTGQIVFETKSRHASVFDELWMKTMEQRKER
jgi:uncharacterized damage-inducible protein DinB